MPGTRQVLGGRGERAAARFLQRRGYAIVARNYRCRLGEVDLIALDGTTLVFVEVKTRAQDEYGSPLEGVTAHKQRQVARAALHFVTRHRLHDRAMRFDVVGIRWRGWWRPAEYEWVRGAFRPPRS